MNTWQFCHTRNTHTIKQHHKFQTIHYKKFWKMMINNKTNSSRSTRTKMSTKFRKPKFQNTVSLCTKFCLRKLQGEWPFQRSRSVDGTEICEVNAGYNKAWRWIIFPWLRLESTARLLWTRYLAFRSRRREFLDHSHSFRTMLQGLLSKNMAYIENFITMIRNTTDLPIP